MHQRSCRVIKGLEQETFDSVDVNETYDDTGQNEHQIISNSIPTIKPGIKLPKSDYYWKLANDFFTASLPVSELVGSDINTVVSSMNSTIYDYFHQNFGALENPNSSHFVDKYKDCSIAMLKSTLKTLKRSKSDLTEIKYVARTIRLRLRSINTNSSGMSMDHDKQIQKSFWTAIFNRVLPYHHHSILLHVISFSVLSFAPLIRLNLLLSQVGFPL